MGEVRSLTALRGIAALWIVLHHFWPNTASPTPYLVAKGYLAVDLFFILSGAVLYHVYAAELAAGRFSLRHFIWRRLARLYPLHALTLIVAVVILQGGPAFGVEGRALPYEMGEMILLHATLLHSWGLTPTGGLNYPSWSLSAEAFAYLLFPALATFVLRAAHWQSLLLSMITLVGWVIILQMFWPGELRPEGDDLVLTRMENDFGALRIVPEFLLGLSIARVAAVIRSGRVWLLVGTALISVGIFLNADLTVIFGFAALILGCLIDRPPAPASIRALGVVSYSLYMCHALIQIPGFKLIEMVWGYPDDSVPLAFLPPMLALTLICATGLHHWVEKPARRVLVSLAERGSVRPGQLRSPPM